MLQRRGVVAANSAAVPVIESVLLPLARLAQWMYIAPTLAPLSTANA